MTTAAAPTVHHVVPDAVTLHATEATSLAGPWDYWLAPAPATDRTPDGQMTLPANWWLRGLDHAGVATFARVFVVPDALAGARLRIRFDGVDYRARVWLDGTELGGHEGYFEPFWFDVDGLSAGPHRIVVEVDSPDEAWGTVWHMHKTLVKGVLAHHDGRPGNGWSKDGQARNSGGIWGPVSIVPWPSTVIIDELVLRAVPAGPGVAEVEAIIGVSTTAGSPARLEATLVFRGRHDDATFSFEAPVTAGRIELRGSARLGLADRWTTWDRGDPALYDVDVELRSAERGPEANGSDPAPPALAAARTRTGVRSVDVDASFRWRLNGDELFVRGTNYIGSYWPGAYDETLARRDLELIRAAGINQVRVHAHVAGPAVYRVADELGLMIWQDFPLQWGYSDDPGFHAEARRQASSMVRLLGSHPSIVAWCCHNESPWDAPWMADEFGGTYDPAHNRQLDADLEADLRAEDPTRYVHRNSGTGDGHMYAGWYFGHWEDFAFRPGGPFVTEYGSLAPPDEPTLRAIIPADAIAYDTPSARRTWAFHDFQHNETRTNIGVLPSDGLDRYVATAQAYQANLLQVATEAYRRGRAARPGGLPADGGPLITGIQQFTAVEGWESLTWAVLDHLRRPKPGYHALARAMAPLLVSAELLDGRGRPAPRPRSGRVIRLRGWLINDLPHPVPPATLRWTISAIADPRLPGGAAAATSDAPDEAVEAVGELAVAGSGPDSSTILGETELRLPAGWHRIALRLTAADGSELAANHLDVEVRR